MLKNVMFVAALMAVSISASATYNQPKSSGNEATSRASSVAKGGSAHAGNSSSVAHGGRGGSASAEGGSVSGSGNSYQSQGQSVTSSGNASVGDVNVEVDGSSYHAAQRRDPVDTAYSAALTSSNDTCMGSSSVGGQGITFGFTFGTTWKDDDCVIRKDARFLHNIQRSTVGLSLMCSKPSILRAVELSGTRADKIACGLEVEPLPTSLVPVPVDSRDDLYGEGENG